VVLVRAFRETSLFLAFICFITLSSLPGLAEPKDQLSPSLAAVKGRFTSFPPRGNSGSVDPATSKVSTVPFDSLRTFEGGYQVAGFGPQGHPHYHWYYTMVGGHPQRGGATELDAPIIPVSVDLLDWNKSVRVVNGHKLHYSVKPFIDPVLRSPLFESWEYTSSDVPTQWVDAIQRASFYGVMQQDWHTLLRPSVKRERTIAVPRGSYKFALHKDGSCCAFVLIDIDVFSNLLFPASPSEKRTPVGAAEHAGDITPKSLSTFLFPNTFLYANGDPNQCCVLGFHSYDSEPGDAHNGFRQRRFVLTFASWISSGIFSPEFQDITALSHELAETVNDPFVASDGLHGLTPWWYSLNGHCQNDLEVADAIEGLMGAAFPIHMHNRTYHPQNVALLPWFEFQNPSTAVAGAYSFPDATLLTTLPPSGLGPGCQ